MNSTDPPRILLSISDGDLTAFADQARRAHDHGVTHIAITPLAEKSRWEIDDPSDPYLQWSIVHNSLFKLFPPALLAGWVPAAWAERNRSLVAAKAGILAELGLRAYALLAEPTWWPESAFAKAPDLRGPRVDHPRRSRHARWAPELSHPEVQALCAEAFAALRRLAPNLDLALFYTNDCGTGLSWTSFQYNLPNGPSDARRPVGPRIRDFLDRMQEAGETAVRGRVDVFMAGCFSTEEYESLQIHRRGPDRVVPLAFPWHAGSDDPTLRSAGVFTAWPIGDFAQPLAVLRGLVRAGAGSGCWGLALNPVSDIWAVPWRPEDLRLECFAAWRNRRPTDEAGVMACAREVLAAAHGAEWADCSLQACCLLDRAQLLYEHFSATGGSLSLMLVTAQRWLTRPLVPFPELLSVEERERWRPHLFQATDEAAALDPLNAQGQVLIDGINSGFLLARMMGDVGSLVGEALAVLGDQPAPTSIEGLRWKLRAWVLVCRTCRNVIRFQTQLAHVKAQAPRLPDGSLAQPVEQTWLFAEGAGKLRTQLAELMRDEIDCATALEQLLRFAPAGTIETANSAGEEDVFTYGPHLADDVAAKRQAMLAHWLDLDRLLARPNI